MPAPGIAWACGNLEQAASCWEEALTYAEKSELAALTSQVLSRLGALHFHQGDFAAAEVAWQNALAKAQAVNHHEFMLLARYGLARLPSAPDTSRGSDTPPSLIRFAGDKLPPEVRAWLAEERWR